SKEFDGAEEERGRAFVFALESVSSMIISRDEHSNKYLTRQSSGDIVNLISDEDPTDEDGDTEVSVSLGEISLEGKKSWESDIGDSDNTGDGGKTAGRAILT
nr:hypothetical protein [Tanacetum cinerariifolium]